MTIRKSDKDLHSEFNELMDEDDASLTDEKYERRSCLIELVEDGYYDPFRIDQSDLGAMKSISELSRKRMFFSLYCTSLLICK